jgi:hypothetical protein
MNILQYYVIRDTMLEVKRILVVGNSKIKGYNDVCAICRESNTLACIGCQVTVLDTTCTKLMGDCGHVFHEHCISKWVNDHPSCPLCNGRWTSGKNV